MNKQQPIAFNWTREMYSAFSAIQDGPGLPNMAELVTLWEALHGAVELSAPTEPVAGAVERAAKRICLATGLDWDSIEDSAPNDHSNDSGDETKEWFRYLARAALG